MNTFKFKVLAYGLAACLTSLSSSAFSQSKDEALLTAATAEQPNLLKTLERLVNIESGSKQFDGLSAIGNLLHNELQAMGGQVSRAKSAVGTGADNIVGKFTGKGKTRILMMAHMDTVYVKGILEKAPFKIIEGFTPKNAGRQMTISAHLPSSSEPTSCDTPLAMAGLIVYLAT